MADASPVAVPAPGAHPFTNPGTQLYTACPYAPKEKKKADEPDDGQDDGHDDGQDGSTARRRLEFVIAVDKDVVA